VLARATCSVIRHHPVVAPDNRSIVGWRPVLSRTPAWTEPAAGARRPAPRQASRMLTRASGSTASAGMGGIPSASQGLPPGAPGASLPSSVGGRAGCCPRGTGWSGCADGMPPSTTCKIRYRCGGVSQEAPDPESDVWQQAGRLSKPVNEEPAGSTSVATSTPTNDHERPRTWTRR
jgi:hypothetical protein